MAMYFELAKTAVVATLALAPALAGSSVAQQAGTDNPPPGATVLQSAQAPGPASDQTASAELVETKAALGRTPVVRGPIAKKNAKYDIAMIGRRDVAHGLNIYSPEREQAMGKQLASEVEAQVTLVSDPAVNDYVNGVVQRLVQNSDAKVPFIVRVIDDAEVNAFALPGGFLFIHTGLIQAADNEAELAAVISHEIAHVAARHATKSMSRSFLWNIGSIPLVFVGGPAGAAVRQIVRLAGPMSVLSFSRNSEREADVLGLEYAHTAGYDPVALVQIFERLRANERDKKSMLSRAFMCHPTTADRIERAQKAVVTYLPPRDAYVVNTSAFDEVKARLERLGLAESKSAFGRPVLRRRTETTNPQTRGDTRN
jgi:predicted Zn-dependent protease